MVILLLLAGMRLLCLDPRLLLPELLRVPELRHGVVSVVVAVVVVDVHGVLWMTVIAGASGRHPVHRGYVLW